MRDAKLLSVALFFIIAGFYSCTKTGAAGATGATGTANVMYSKWAALTVLHLSSNHARLYQRSMESHAL